MSLLYFGLDVFCQFEVRVPDFDAVFISCRAVRNILGLVKMKNALESSLCVSIFKKKLSIHRLVLYGTHAVPLATTEILNKINKFVLI
jgi:hypothetical protein